MCIALCLLYSIGPLYGSPNLMWERIIQCANINRGGSLRVCYHMSPINWYNQAYEVIFIICVSYNYKMVTRIRTTDQMILAIFLSILYIFNFPCWITFLIIWFSPLFLVLILIQMSHSFLPALRMPPPIPIVPSIYVCHHTAVLPMNFVCMFFG